jgi:hypothetical protein
VVGEGVGGDGDLHHVAPASVVRRLEVEGDGDQCLDTLDVGGMRPKRGAGRGTSVRHGGGGGAVTQGRNPSATAVVGEGTEAEESLTDTMWKDRIRWVSHDRCLPCHLIYIGKYKIYNYNRITTIMTSIS